jgi:hypothetical protein
LFNLANQEQSSSSYSLDFSSSSNITETTPNGLQFGLLSRHKVTFEKRKFFSHFFSNRIQATQFIQPETRISNHGWFSQSRFSQLSRQNKSLDQIK